MTRSWLLKQRMNPRRSGVFSSLRNLREFFLFIHKYACWVIWKVETTRRVVSVKGLAPVLCGQFVCGWHKALCSIFILAGNESAAELIFFDLKSINRVTSDTWSHGSGCKIQQVKLTHCTSLWSTWEHLTISAPLKINYSDRMCKKFHHFKNYALCCCLMCSQFPQIGGSTSFFLLAMILSQVSNTTVTILARQ